MNERTQIGENNKFIFQFSSFYLQNNINNDQYYLKKRNKKCYLFFGIVVKNFTINKS